MTDARATAVTPTLASIPVGPGEASSWTALRKDFVEPDTPCALAAAGHRPHRLACCHGYILRDIAGNEAAIGAACAQALPGISAQFAGLPDFTARDASAAHEDSPASFESDRASDHGGEAQRLGVAIRYLLLRMDKVASIPRVHPSVRFGPLEPIHADYRRHGTLTPQQVRRVLAIERGHATPAALRAMPLLDVYTAYVQLQRALLGADRIDRQRFLRGLIDWLARHLTLTRPQIEAAGLALHPRAFQA